MHNTFFFFPQIWRDGFYFYFSLAVDLFYQNCEGW